MRKLRVRETKQEKNKKLLTNRSKVFEVKLSQTKLSQVKLIRVHTHEGPEIVTHLRTLYRHVSYRFLGLVHPEPKITFLSLPFVIYIIIRLNTIQSPEMERIFLFLPMSSYLSGRHGPCVRRSPTSPLITLSVVTDPLYNRPSSFSIPSINRPQITPVQGPGHSWPHVLT